MDDGELIRDLVIYGRSLEKPSRNVLEVMTLLRAQGINFAEVLSTVDGRLAGCTAFPSIAEGVEEQVAAMLVEGMLEDLHCRR